MFKNVIMWVLTKVFKIQTDTTQKEIEANQKYAKEYQDIDSINFNAIFSNKLANYVVNDSSFNVSGENARADFLDKMGQSMWKKMKKIVSMSFGYGGVILVPYSKGGKLYYNIVAQDRLTINKMDGDLITGATVLAEIRTITNTASKKVYMRWTDYNVENNKLVITQRYTNDKEQEIPTPEFWENILETMTITNVDRVSFGYIKSPVNNRVASDKYGVPITYGCDETIDEIRECLRQIAREFDLKEAFIGADITMFNGNNALPSNGLFKKIDSGDDSFFTEFSPAIRDSSYYARLQELYKRLENEIGVSNGIISEMQTQNATATEIKKALYDTFSVCDDMRSSVEQGLEDFFYACNVLANAYNLAPAGEYDLSYSWSYGLIEDSQTEFSQMIQGLNQGVTRKEELRNWLHPEETMEESKKVVEEIKAQEPTTADLFNE